MVVLVGRSAWLKDLSVLLKVLIVEMYYFMCCMYYENRSEWSRFFFMILWKYVILYAKKANCSFFILMILRCYIPYTSDRSPLSWCYFVWKISVDSSKNLKSCDTCILHVMPRLFSAEYCTWEFNTTSFNIYTYIIALIVPVLVHSRLNIFVGLITFALLEKSLHE